MILNVDVALTTAALAGAGLLVGSFLGLVSLRLPAGEGIVFGRSRCGECRRPLAPWRMAPVFSWVLSRGRCSDCGAIIPVRYPLIEIAAGAVGVWAALSQPDLLAAALTAVLGWQLLLLAIVDAEHFWLPDVLTLPLAASGVAAALLLPGSTATDNLIGAVAGFGVLWAIGWLYRKVRGREGLGGGDPFMLGAGGAWVGWIGLPSVLLWASAAALSVVAARILLRRPVSGQDRLPFGVFLAVGFWCVWLWGPLGL